MQTKKLSTPFHVKEVGTSGEFSGYGSVFDVEDSYGDVVEKGAFLDSLDTWKGKGQMPALLWQHKADEPIGVWESMKEDDHGLLVEGRLLIDDDPLAKRAYAHLKAGSVSGLSIGYSIPKGGGAWDEAAGIYRLSQVNLWETSLVTFPANEAAQIDVVKDALQSQKEFERFLRDAGLSRRQAKSLMAGGFDSLTQRDAAGTDSELEKAAANLLNLIKQASK